MRHQKNPGLTHKVACALVRHADAPATVRKADVAAAIARAEHCAEAADRRRVVGKPR